MSLIKGLRLIEQGYNQQNWQKVKDGYELVSGEPLEYVMMGEDYTSEPTPIPDEELPKTVKFSTKKPVKKTKSKSVQQRVEESAKRPDKHGIKLVEGQIDTSLGSGTVKYRGNAFNPDNYEYVDEAPWLKDNKVRKNKRASFKLKSIECDKCGNKYEVHPDLVSTGEGAFNVCENCLKKKK